MCFEPVGANKDDGPEGECPDCGGITYGGEAAEICFYSPQEERCETCGSNPCIQDC